MRYDIYYTANFQIMENLSKSTKGNNTNTALVTGIRECLPERHKRRDNKFGVIWYVKCGLKICNII